MLPVKSFSVLLVLFTLGGCGGGGGSSSGGSSVPTGGSSGGGSGGGEETPELYSGTSTPAIMSPENASLFSAQIFESTQTPTDDLLYKTSVDQPRHPEFNRLIFDQFSILRLLVDSELSSNSSLHNKLVDQVNRDVQISENTSCSSGGSISLNGTLTDDLLGTLDIVLSNCSEDGLTMNGAIQTEFFEVDLANEFFERVLFEYQSLNVTYEGISIGLDGSVLFENQFDSTETTLTFDLVGRSSGEEDVYLEDLVVVSTFDPSDSSYSESWNGRIYIDTQGYAIVATEVEILFLDLSGNLLIDQGALTFTGASNTRLRSEVTNGAVLLQLDENGDGLYELNSQREIDSLRAGPDSASSSPIAQISSNSLFDGLVINDPPFFLSGAQSEDADGDFLSYSWSVLSAPPTSTDVLSSDDLVEVEANIETPGNYLFSLLVEDQDENQSAADYEFRAVEISRFEQAIPSAPDAEPYSRILSVQASDLDGNMFGCISPRQNFGCNSFAKISEDLDLIDVLELPHLLDTSVDAADVNLETDTAVVYGYQFGEQDSVDGGYFNGYRLFNIQDFDTQDVLSLDDTYGDDIVYLEPSQGLILLEDYIVVLDNHGNDEYRISSIDIETGSALIHTTDVYSTFGNPLSSIDAELIYNHFSGEFIVWAYHARELFVQKYSFNNGEFSSTGSMFLPSDISTCVPGNIWLSGEGRWITDNCGRFFESNLESDEPVFSVELNDSVDFASLSTAKFLVDQTPEGLSWIYLSENLFEDGINVREEYRLHAYDWDSQEKIVDIELPSFGNAFDSTDFIYEEDGDPLTPDYGYLSQTDSLILINHVFGNPSDSVILRLN